MPIKRRRRGFERAGMLPLDGLGLPRTRARELILAQAWERVAGPALAERARAVRVQRGVLELEVTQPRWIETLIDLLPALAGKLSRDYPQLGVRKFRLMRPDSEPCGPARTIEDQDVPSDHEHTEEPSEAEREPLEVTDPRPQEVRLEELARRYVDRGEGQNQ